MTEESIIICLSKWLDNVKFPYKVPRCFIYGWECDFWCMTKDGETREFEIKVTRQDFLNDAKKEKHIDVSRGANYFYYVCPEGLIKKEEVGKYGLIYVYDNRLSIVKKPSRLNSSSFNDWKMLANKMYFKWYNIWLDKKIDGQIMYQEWQSGFNIELTEFENA